VPEDALNADEEEVVPGGSMDGAVAHGREPHGHAHDLVFDAGQEVVRGPAAERGEHQLFQQRFVTVDRLARVGGNGGRARVEAFGDGGEVADGFRGELDAPVQFRRRVVRRAHRLEGRHAFEDRFRRSLW
jgi:hypothetical protein